MAELYVYRVIVDVVEVVLAADNDFDGEGVNGGNANVTRGAIDFLAGAKMGLCGVFCNPIVRRRVTLLDRFNNNVLSYAMRR